MRLIVGRRQRRVEPGRDGWSAARKHVAEHPAVDGGLAFALTWLVLCAYFLVLTGPQGHSRYREQCAPVLIPLAACGLHMVLQRVRAFRQSAINNQQSTIK